MQQCYRRWSMASNREAAFPVSYGPDGTPGYSDGMSIRDYFAGQALAGFAANPHPDHHGEDGARVLAEDCFAVADAMIVERRLWNGE
jgi:hypothetical protein